MLKEYFYNESIKKVVTVFGSLFNNINVLRTNANDASIIRVPLAYGPKQKFLARIDENENLNDEAKVGIRLPRMSFEITSLTYSGESSLSRMNKKIAVRSTDGDFASYKLGTYSSYRMGLQLNIMSKTQSEALQILEQILPYFKPEYTVTINGFSDYEEKADLPFTLTNVTFQDDFEGDFLTRRAIIYTIDFETYVRFYGPGSGNAPVIKQVIVNEYSDKNLDNRISVQTITATGTVDNYTITETIELDFE